MYPAQQPTSAVQSLDYRVDCLPYIFPPDLARVRQQAL